MSKRIERPAVARHIQIFEEDWDFLEANFGRHTARPLGAGRAIRDLVHARVRSMRERQNLALDQLSQVERDKDGEIMARVLGQGTKV